MFLTIVVYGMHMILYEDKIKIKDKNENGFVLIES